MLKSPAEHFCFLGKMQLYFLAATWTCAAYIIYKLISNTLINRHNAAEEKRLGCKPSPRWPSSWPFGLDLVWEALKSDRAKLFPELLLSRFERMNRTDYHYVALGTKSFVTADPKNVQALLATQFKDFMLGDIRKGNFQPLLGHGIFTLDGEGWDHSRAMMRPQFSRDQVSDLDLEENHIQNMMQALPVDSTSGWTAPVDLQVLFFRLTLDSACEFLFGESVGSQLANLPGNVSTTSTSGATHDEKSFAKAFDTSQAYLATRARMMEFHWLYNTSEFRRNCKETHDFVDYFVNLALNKGLKEKQLEEGTNSSKEKYVFLDALAAQTRDPIELRSQLLNILLAGRDTTASLLGWLFYILVRNPHHYSQLRAAIIQDFGTYEKPSEISFATLKGCQVLQHFLNETLRLYPVVPANSREAVRDTTLPTGGGPSGTEKMFVPKGTNVEYSVHVMHRRKDLWGEDANDFNPSRWKSRKPGWEYLPFNGGPRICLGRKSSNLIIATWSVS